MPYQTRITKLFDQLLPLRILCRAALAFVMFSSPLVATAGQFDGNYTIEMIVFERPDAPVEAASLDRSPRYPNNRRLLDRDVKRGNLKTVPTLNAASLSLTSDAARLRQRGYSVLFHEAWTQYVNASSDPAVVILGGDNIGGIRELSGYVSVYVKRYLHFQSNLWLVNSQISSDDVFSLIEIPSPVSNQPVQGANISSISQIKTSRKMRSAQLHYIDHPQFGILVQITK